MDRASANRVFETFRDDFKARTASFSITEEEPDIAMVEVKRAFLRDVIQTSLTDLNLVAELNSTDLPQQRFSALMRPFEAEKISCEQGNCGPVPTCAVSLTQCKRLRDTRDCSSCLFRNPLNNRCVSQAVDPICEAARTRQNIKYEDDRATCVARADEAKRDCEQLITQAQSSCEIESGFDQSSCETIKSGIAALQKGIPLATADAQVAIQGQLSAVFSNISIEGDFTRMKMDLTIRSNLKLGGKLDFQPGKIPGPLASCISAWSVPFTSRVVTSTEVNSLLTTLAQDNNGFTAQWSGYVLSIEASPSPLETIFVGNSHLLANCSIGLTVNDVEQAFMGADAGFFSGQLKFEIQPEPAILRLSPATVTYGEQDFEGKAIISSDHVRYEIGR
jgi:hypothetical protein